MDAVFSLHCAPGSVSRAARPDEPWLAAARTGDPAALEQMYHAYKQPVHAVCFRLLGSEDDALDAVQTTFVRAFRELPRFRGESSLKTWIYRIAVNEALTLIRRRRPTTELSEVLPSPGDAGASVVEQAAVQAALRRLKPDLRAILVLRFWEELDYREIGAVMKLNPPAVKMRLHRARAAFRKLYQEEER